jgi:riboflavin-specific deaminase-like protein
MASATEDWAWQAVLARRARAEGRDGPAGAEPPAPLVDLFGELAATPAGGRFVVAHLGQSVDGRIATESGHSHYIGCDESLLHLHRLRALVDAVVVGVGTVLADAPRLTTRLCAGPDPVRVVLDPRARLTAEASVVADRAAPTLVVHSEDVPTALPGHVETAALAPDRTGALPPAGVLAVLAARGLTRVLIEGGGRTVSSFVAAGALDRLQFAVAPLLIGSGRPALTLPVVETLEAALRPPCRRYDLGADTLFDFDLRSDAGAG